MSRVNSDGGTAEGAIGSEEESELARDSCEGSHAAESAKGVEEKEWIAWRDYALRINIATKRRQNF